MSGEEVPLENGSGTKVVANWGQVDLKAEFCAPLPQGKRKAAGGKTE